MENERPSFEEMAEQLRKPTGNLGSSVGDSMNRSNEPMYQQVLDHMQLKSGEHVLEIGFGNGKLFQKLFATAEHLQIAGIDYSLDMVQAAEENNAQAISSGSLELRQGNSDSIPFPDNSFDKVFCCNVIYFWENPADHLKEIYRVLKPGGIFYVGFRNRKTMSAFPFTQFGFILYEEDEWKKILEENNFKPTTTLTSNQVLEIEGNRFDLVSHCIASVKNSR